MPFCERFIVNTEYKKSFFFLNVKSFLDVWKGSIFYIVYSYNFLHTKMMTGFSITQYKYLYIMKWGEF